MNSRYFTREEQFETLSKTKSLKDTGPEALIQKSYTYRNGAVYTGQWLGNFRNGRGRMEWPDSASYEGSWEWGYASGRGVFIDSVGNKYEGDFKNSMAHGRGTYTNTMGAVYEGEWRFDMQHGRGIERWTNSNSYFEGEFKDGLRCGHGVWTHDQKRYSGQWKNNMMHGEGKMQWDYNLSTPSEKGGEKTLAGQRSSTTNTGSLSSRGFSKNTSGSVSPMLNSHN